MIQFQAKYLPALMRFKAKRDIRYYLNGVHVTPHKDGGAALVATDGHMMLVIHDSQAICTEKTIFHAQSGLDAFCKKESAIVTVNKVTQRMMIAAKNEELFIQPGKCLIEGNFPSWEKVLPKFENLKLSVADCINADLLSGAILAHPDRAMRNGGSIRLWQAEESSSISVEYIGHPEMIAVVMPVHNHGSKKDHIEAWTKTFGQMEIAGI